MGNDHIIVVVDSGNIDGRNSSPRQREPTSMALLAEDLCVYAWGIIVHITSRSR